jgi:hypothetical protein
MKDERSWLSEVQWWLSSVAALLAILLLVKLVAAGGSIAPASTPGSNLADRFGLEFLWPIGAVVVLSPFVLSAALGFRLLVPTFRTVPPRMLGVFVATWPLVLGVVLLTRDQISLLIFAIVGIAWGLAMPLPKQTLLTGRPILGGVIAGLAFATLAPWDGLLVAFAWCLWRLRSDPAQAAATAAAAAVLPGIFMALELPGASDASPVLSATLEVIMLAGVAVAGFAMWRRKPLAGAGADTDSDRPDREDDADDGLDFEPEPAES